jgi:hypothetical protein
MTQKQSYIRTMPNALKTLPCSSYLPVDFQLVYEVFEFPICESLNIL